MSQTDQTPFGQQVNVHEYDDVPMFKGDPWRGACPECGSLGIKQSYRATRDDVWKCGLKGCNAYDIEPVDRKEIND